MTLHNDIWCSGTSVYIDLFQIRKGMIWEPFSCQTEEKYDFEKGANLSWTGSELGSCSTTYFDGLNDIEFKILSTDGDDFCPRILRIYLNNGDAYKSDEMRDWVDDSKGNDYRIARKRHLYFLNGNIREPLGSQPLWGIKIYQF